ncbi:hypothetical protein E4T43_07862 [Aureobasidium subglaciale]|nr:hypothetical protein E4T43_07862 [Aureobasidium subglaciale]
MGQYDRKAQSQRKHGPILSSSTSKAPARPPPIAKPEWRGSGYMKKAKAKVHLDGPKDAPLPQDQLLPVELQQLMLNIFQNSFAASEDFEELKELLREVNEALLEGDLETAFGSEEKREGYALRWSPSRALAYANVMAEFAEQRADDEWVQRLSDATLQSKTKALCFGGGAAELMAFAGLLRHLRPDTVGKPQGEIDANEGTTAGTSAPILDVQLIDSADWSFVISRLETSATTPPPLSKYASASARAANTALVNPSTLNVTFTKSDIFALSTAQLQEIIGTEPVLVTLFLTLNDLYNTSIPRTTTFLRKLDALLPVGSTLLILDTIAATASSPIPDSDEVTEYSMQWLVDRVLLGKPIEPAPIGKGKKENEEYEKNLPIVRWEKIVAEEMKVNRLEEKLRYPGSLENVRYQVLGFSRV